MLELADISENIWIVVEMSEEKKSLYPLPNDKIMDLSILKADDRYYNSYNEICLL